MNFVENLKCCCLLFALFSVELSVAAPTSEPNIVYILADDLGYGDVSCLNLESKIRTPQMDRVAAEGLIFTDAHSSSSVCSPTRYGVMTGRYNWRSQLKRGVLGGFSQALIPADRATVPAYLHQHGYHTACIGKWHLGMNWPLRDGRFASGYPDAPKVDYTQPIQRGPNSIGFDYFHGISASLDMPPFAFIENDRVTEIPTTEKKWIRSGPAAEHFEAIDVLPTITRKAVAYINERAQDAKNGNPFFLYFPLNSPHTPILPTDGWKGKSGLNPYADFVLQTDATVGSVLDALDRNGLAENTLVIVASDNGCSPRADFPALADKGHRPSHHFRGHKADIYEGGHRIPFLVRWPGRVKPGTTSAQTICLTDLFATCAHILNKELPAGAAEDSVSILPALEGRDKSPLREATVHHSINGSFAIRQGQWKLSLCPGSGGWSDPRPAKAAASKEPANQLYQLTEDIGERRNRQAEQPEIVKRMTALLQSYVDRGRSTPGPTQANDGAIALRPTVKASKGKRKN